MRINPNNIMYEPNTGCHIWTGSVKGKDATKYGFMRVNGRERSVHRAAYELANGPIPEGMQVNHTCDVSLCANPAHLYLGTQQDNVDDRQRRGRYRKGRTYQGSDHIKAVLTREAVQQARAMRGTMSQAAIARHFGVSNQTICNLFKGKTYANV